MGRRAVSREVRRVPVDWKHPVEPNPHWRFQQEMRAHRGGPESRLHGPDEMFQALFAGPLSSRQEEWDQGKRQWDEGTHEHIAFLLNYHGPDGYLNGDGTRDEPVAYQIYAADGNTFERAVFLTSAAEVLEHYPYEKYAGTRPDSDRYMPDFDVPADELGWCLYETVSEGTPVTPVFATSAELVEHLVQHGIDWDQDPWRREAAERMVASGSSFGTFVTFRGQLFDGAKDADLLEEVFSDRT
ncbi:MAG: hypothetical protein JWP11_1310 [Frankiales bacterium]|nr:hypothetical protein [Frankiales bacterium]